MGYWVNGKLEVKLGVKLAVESDVDCEVTGYWNKEEEKWEVCDDEALEEAAWDIEETWGEEWGAVLEGVELRSVRFPHQDPPGKDEEEYRRFSAIVVVQYEVNEVEIEDTMRSVDCKLSVIDREVSFLYQGVVGRRAFPNQRAERWDEVLRQVRRVVGKQPNSELVEVKEVWVGNWTFDGKGEDGQDIRDSG